MLKQTIDAWLLGESTNNFPYLAIPILCIPSFSTDVVEKVIEASEKSQLVRKTSMVQKKGYTNDEEPEELQSSLTSIIKKMPPSPSIVRNRNGKHNEKEKKP